MTIRNVRRGLVIVGGGAKGAYSLGCMKSLRRAGYRFEAVSGTSAGSLNAAIWSSGDLEAGERLWAELSPETSFQRRRALKFLPQPLARLAGAAGVITALLIARMRGYPIDGRNEAVVSWAVFAAVWGSTALAAVFLTDWDLSAALVATLACTVLTWPIIRGGGPRTGRTRLRPLLFFLCVLAASQLAARVAPDISLAWAPVGLLGILLAGAAAWAVLVLLLFPLASLAVLDSAPLRRTLTAFLRDRPLKMPTYVTTAYCTDLFDPDAPQWVAENRTGAHASAADISGPWDPFPDACWIPRYVRIDDESTDRAVDWLMATAALPFGVVPPVAQAKVEYVDGGVVDNQPVLPLLAHRLDEIVLLELNPAPAKRQPGHEARCAGLERLLRLAERPLPPRQHIKPSRTRRDPPEFVPLRPFFDFPRILEIRPSRSLGGIFGGLLNFSPEYARRLICEGEADTERYLRSLGGPGSHEL